MKDMKPLKTMSTFFCLTLVAAAFSPMAKADVTWDRRTEITFKTPVEIPAVHQPGWQVLPPGTYVFKVMKAETSRDVVQIFSKDERIVAAEAKWISFLIESDSEIHAALKWLALAYRQAVKD